MNPFPVYDSRLSASHLGLFLQEKYPLKDPILCRILKTGINHSYLLKDGVNRKIFRLYSYNWRTKREIEEELRLLSLLHESGVPISYPIADATGNFIQEIIAPEGLRFGVLFSFAEGEKIRNFTDDMSYNIGVAMARFHQTTQDLALERVTYNEETLLLSPLQRIKTSFAADSATMAFVESTTHSLVEKMKEIRSDQVRFGTVHLDIWFDNMHVTPDGGVTFFDFDFCGNGWQALDLAYFNVQLFNTEPDPDEYQRKLQRFLEGYETVTLLSPEEKRLIPYLAVCLWFFYLGVQCQRFDDWGNLFISEDYFKRFIELIRKWCTKQAIFE
ncbi:phosphotransferase enzyme family protein [Runella slithyformis]|uniref:Aminoglycoside phosphotransferase n=1 Tax=Runella slithyformis (strain ATCC 29530 / DSM 19594 / LMG 11500 / NCIMB 11436 / LSU 4) TaxID=761193 RepID=A0A7U3ZGW7_RUNSL|nr:phosphotransferase [Runella slithyformis]AEI47007.1 aminoglycoside phosphotransferase [Runella slithyformis DSM 19594]